MALGMPQDLPIPNGDDKNPLRKHRITPESQGVSPWTEQLCDETFATDRGEYEHKNLGLLLHDLFVLDFDVEEGHHEPRDLTMFQSLFPGAIERCPTARTAKGGLHVFWRRTPLADELGLWDNARGLHAADGDTLLLDIKTRCSTGTRSNLCVPPHASRHWVRSLLDLEPPPLPEGLARWLASLRAAPRLLPAKRDRSGVTTSSARPVLETDLVAISRRPEKAPAAPLDGWPALPPQAAAEAEDLRALGLSSLADRLAQQGRDPKMTKPPPQGAWLPPVTQPAPHFFLRWDFPQGELTCPLCGLGPKKPGSKPHSDDFEIRVCGLTGRRHLRSMAGRCTAERVELGPRCPRSCAAMERAWTVALGAGRLPAGPVEAWVQGLTCTGAAAQTLRALLPPLKSWYWPPAHGVAIQDSAGTWALLQPSWSQPARMALLTGPQPWCCVSRAKSAREPEVALLSPVDEAALGEALEGV